MSLIDQTTYGTYSALYHTDGKLDYGPTVSSARAKRKYLDRPAPTKVKRDPSGWRSPTPWTVTSEEARFWEGHIVQRKIAGSPVSQYPASTVTFDGFLEGVIPVTVGQRADMSLPSSNMTNRSTIEALLKVKDQKVNLAQAFAERVQTANLLSDSFARVMKAYSEVKRGKVSAAFATLGVRPRRLSKDISKRWLEMQYGWLPLLQDVHGAYEQITKPVKPVSSRFKVSRSISDTRDGSEFGYSKAALVTYKSTATVKTVLWFEVTNPALLIASQVGLTNPATVVWELTPWSFVVDWILPVGNLIEAMSATAGTRFISGTVTKTVRGLTDFTALPWSPSYDMSYSGSASAKHESFYMNRSVLRSLPAVGPSNLYVKNPFSTTHVLNALALWRGLRN